MTFELIITVVRNRRGNNTTILKAMVDIQKAREILWKDCEAMTDEEVQYLIDYISAICSLVIEEYIKEKSSK